MMNAPRIALSILALMVLGASALVLLPERSEAPLRTALFEQASSTDSTSTLAQLEDTPVSEDNPTEEPQPKGVPITIGSTLYHFDVADTPALRSQGLSGREGLAPRTGLLFIFDEARKHSFWMKDMLFSIDIVWLSDAWCVVGLAERVAPSTYPDTFAPEAPAMYVIEVVAGVAEAESVGIGTCLEPPQI